MLCDDWMRRVDGQRHTMAWHGIYGSNWLVCSDWLLMKNQSNMFSKKSANKMSVGECVAHSQSFMNEIERKKNFSRWQIAIHTLW